MKAIVTISLKFTTNGCAGDEAEFSQFAEETGNNFLSVNCINDLRASLKQRTKCNPTI